MTTPDTDPRGAESAERTPATGRRGVGLDRGIGLLVVAWAAALAAAPLTDNSWFTHLATGRIILDEVAIPSTDPYSFTAPGADWTVQSWLASVAYAAAEQVAGVLGIRVLLVAVFVAAGALVWRLTAPAVSLLPRVGIALLALAVASGLWGIRPYMAGIIGLGLVRLWLDRPPARPWLAVPLLWVWANVHGSFPLALALVVTTLVGEHLDGGVREPTRRLATWVGIGTLAAAVSPLGPRLLLFPLTALERSDALREIVEWRAPEYVSIPQRAWLVLALVTIAALVRRPSWRATVPSIVFIAAAAIAVRNVAMASMVVLPVVAHGLGDLGQLRIDEPSPLGRALRVVGAIVAAGAILVAVTTPAGDLDRYPLRALAYVDPAAAPTATSDVTGNLLELLDGPTGTVFIDDRVDMYPTEHVDDYVTLYQGEVGWERVLDRWAIEVVVWPTERPLTALLAADAAWRLVLVDETAVVACRRSSTVCGDR